MVGSLTMWSVPHWAPLTNEYDQDRVHNTILTEHIIHEINNNASSDISIVDAMYNIKLRQIQQLQECIQNDYVQIDLRYGDIQPLDSIDGVLLHEIKSLRADTISWSNLVDYFVVEQFHELAHYWSTESTLHYGYTMNWPLTMYGTYISVYHTIKERATILDETI